MPGAVAAIIAAKRARGGQQSTFTPTKLSAAEEKRRAAAAKEYERRVRINKIIKAYDKNKSGKLERDQVVKLLTDLDDQITGTAKGVPPSDEQVDWILNVSDKAKDGCIDRTELEIAMSAWTTYCNLREEMETVMAKFDSSQNGKLSRDEVKAYLTELNGGIEVTEEEVDMVFNAADVQGDGEIDLMELTRATSLWYGYVEEQKKNPTCGCILQ